jgi:type IV pilus assembly protein PilV
MAPRRDQSGVMLIEALVGILIFSIGILAMIGMQATAIRNTTDARYRSEAGFLANQIIGTMWTDRANLSSYDTSGASYTPRDSWRTTVETNLPGINVSTDTLAPTITVNSATGQVTVTIQWQQPGESTSRTLQFIEMINGST